MRVKLQAEDESVENIIMGSDAEDKSIAHLSEREPSEAPTQDEDLVRCSSFISFRSKTGVLLLRVQNRDWRLSFRLTAAQRISATRSPLRKSDLYFWQTHLAVRLRVWTQLRSMVLPRCISTISLTVRIQGCGAVPRGAVEEDVPERRFGQYRLR